MLINVATPPLRSPAETLSQARPITYLRVSVTDRCNLRCGYCMPTDQSFAEKEHLLTFEEIVRVAEILVGQGVRKIRLTGGEPLVRRDLPRLVAMLKGISPDLSVVMTTNGTLLRRFAHSLRSAGLDRLNVSLDTLREDRFARLTHREGVEQVIAGIDAARSAGFEGTKINMVVMKGVNDDEIGEMLSFAHHRGCELRFLEFMPLTSNGYGQDVMPFPLAAIRKEVECYGSLQPRPFGSGPAQTFTLEPMGLPVGFIAAISLPFCETCNRIRLTAEGQLRSCLFEGGEVSAREILRREEDSEESLLEAFEYLRRVKPPVHEGRGHVQMNRVGG